MLRERRLRLEELVVGSERVFPVRRLAANGLEPGTTKNNDGRLVYLTAELKVQIVAQLDRVRSLESDREPR